MWLLPPCHCKLASCVRWFANLVRFVNYIRSLPGYEQLYDPSPPHFDRKIKDLVFATDISKMMVDCFVSYDELKFVLD